MNDFPRMLYVVGGPHEIHGGRFDTLIVDDSDALETALANGWSLTTASAKDALAAELAHAASAAIAGPDSPPSRDELKRKADELKLSYPANIPSAKLAEMIETALAKG